MIVVIVIISGVAYYLFKMLAHATSDSVKVRHIVDKILLHVYISEELTSVTDNNSAESSTECGCHQGDLSIG